MRWKRKKKGLCFHFGFRVVVPPVNLMLYLFFPTNEESFKLIYIAEGGTKRGNKSTPEKRVDRNYKHRIRASRA